MSIHVGWSGDDKQYVWITDGKELGDFYGRTIGVHPSDLPALIASLRKLEAEGRKCAWAGCENPATALACGRWQTGEDGHPLPDRYCEEHAHAVMREGYPEYLECCPNCGCRFGVG